MRHLYEISFYFQFENIDDDFSNLRKILNLPNLEENIRRHFAEKKKDGGLSSKKVDCESLREEKLDSPVGYKEKQMNFKNLPVESDHKTKYNKANSKKTNSSTQIYGNKSTIRNCITKRKDLVQVNSSYKGMGSLSYEEYMGQLTPMEIDLLYTAYYQDFLMFGYDPAR